MPRDDRQGCDAMPSLRRDNGLRAQHACRLVRAFHHLRYPRRYDRRGNRHGGTGGRVDPMNERDQPDPATASVLAGLAAGRTDISPELRATYRRFAQGLYTRRCAASERAWALLAVRLQSLDPALPRTKEAIHLAHNWIACNPAHPAHARYELALRRHRERTEAIERAGR